VSAVLGRVVVVGLGLIGGSIATGLRARGGASSIGAVDRADVLAAAGALLDERAEPGTGAARALLAAADLVVLALPARGIERELAATLDAIAPGAVVTDVGSTKRAIAAAADAHPRRARFVPGHPMAGRAVGGLAAAQATLFDGARWFVVPAGADPDAVDRVRALATALGAAPLAIDPGAHDRAMAAVSHVPQVVASALVARAAAAGAMEHAGPAFRDIARPAGGPAGVWRDILAGNRDEVARELAALAHELGAVASALAAGDEGIERAIALLDAARQAKEG
jgi:prephenate dehydrogenase